MVLLDRLEEGVEILQAGDVGADAGGLIPDFRDRDVKFFLAPTGDNDVRALGCKPFGDCQTDAGARASHDSDLALEGGSHLGP